MSTATATAIPPATARARSRYESAQGLRDQDLRAFQAFVDRNRHLFSDYVSRRLSGPHSSSAEDALQEGLLSIWREWADWPSEEDQRIRFARQALRIAALEAIRKRTGRDGSPRAGEFVVDFSELDQGLPSLPRGEVIARELGRAIAQQSLVKDQLAYIEKAVLIAAIATLTDLEQRVLFMTAQGDDCKQIATDLGVTHQQAREALMRARRLCRMLIEHADGQKVSEKEAKLLWQYQDGQLSGKRARELKRHIEHCTACQRLLGLEENIGTNGALVILPIPVVLLAAGSLLDPASASAAPAATSGEPAAGVPGGGADLGVQIGGNLLAPVAPQVTFGSVLAGATAKAGLALGALAATGSIAGVYTLAKDRQAERTRAAQPAAALTATHTPRAASGPRGTSLAAARTATTARTAATAPAASRTSDREPRTATRPARAEKRARSARRPANPRRTTVPARPSTTAAPRPRSAVTSTTARTAAPAARRIPAPAPASRPASRAPGTEFVLGG